jgi:hypothetical protein
VLSFSQETWAINRDRHCSVSFPPLKSLHLILRRALVFFNLFLSGTRLSPHLRLPAKGKILGPYREHQRSSSFHLWSPDAYLSLTMFRPCWRR